MRIYVVTEGAGNMGQDEHSLFRNRALARTPQFFFFFLFIFFPLAAQKRNFGRGAENSKDQQNGFHMQKKNQTFIPNECKLAG